MDNYMIGTWAMHPKNRLANMVNWKHHPRLDKQYTKLQTTNWRSSCFPEFLCAETSSLFASVAMPPSQLTHFGLSETIEGHPTSNSNQFWWPFLSIQHEMLWYAVCPISRHTIFNGRKLGNRTKFNWYSSSLDLRHGPAQSRGCTIKTTQCGAPKLANP